MVNKFINFTFLKNLIPRVVQLNIPRHSYYYQNLTIVNIKRLLNTLLLGKLFEKRFLQLLEYKALVQKQKVHLFTGTQVAE